MPKLIDLDAAMPEDLEVKLGGKTYLIPGDIDVKTLGRLQGLLDSLAGEEVDLDAVAERLGAEVKALLSVRQPVEGELQLTLTQVVALVRGIMQHAEEAMRRSIPFSTEPPPLPARSAGRGKKS